MFTLSSLLGSTISVHIYVTKMLQMTHCYLFFGVRIWTMLITIAYVLHKSLLIDDFRLYAISFIPLSSFLIFGKLIFFHCGNHIQLTRSCKWPIERLLFSKTIRSSHETRSLIRARDHCDSRNTEWGDVRDGSHQATNQTGECFFTFAAFDMRMSKVQDLKFKTY